MENFDVNPLKVINQLNDIELIYSTFKKKTYTEKFKYYLKIVFEKMQIGLLRLSFLYAPIYIMLLFFKIITVFSTFSLYYLLSYCMLILLVVLINREEGTFK